MSKQAAIYHYSLGDNSHPWVSKNAIKRLEHFAESEGYHIVKKYQDYTRLRSEQVEFDHFLSESGNFDAVFVQDLKQLGRTTTKCISVINNLVTTGLTVYTLKNGCFRCTSTSIFEEPLKVASYFNCSVGSTQDCAHIIALQNDIFRLYVKKKTKWEIIDQYSDMSERQNKGEQPDLERLTLNRDKYDLVLVQSLNDLHERTSTFTMIWEALKIDIYSVKSGLLKYERR